MTESPSEAPETGTPNTDTAPTAAVVSPDPTFDPVIGRVIDGRYLILSKMATGGMASVYVARDQKLDRLVALKLMHRHLAESTEFVERFRREARSAARIAHPSVVPIFDQGVHEGQGYLVMELVDGPDLRSYMSTHGPIELGAALQFVQQIFSGLAAAHRTGVIHRDLKPENILVTQEGNLRIVDFGLARATTEGTLSTTGAIMGTVAYLAPEVALKGTLDSRTDIFAVGVMTYELLTGEVPGDPANPLMTAMSRVNEDLPAPSQTVDWLPQELDDLVAALTARDPQERPASAAAAAALVAHSAAALDEQTLARPLPVPAGVEVSSDPNATDALTQPAGTTVLPIEQRVVTASGSVATPEQMRVSKRTRWGWVITSIFLLLGVVAVGGWWWWGQYGPGAYLDVPDLAGMTVEQAEAELAGLNVASYTTFEHSDTVEADLVIGTDPAAGQKSHRNSEINIIVSKGILNLVVPDIAGMSAADARQTLTEVGFSDIKDEDVWSSDVEEGQVVGTDPPIGEEVAHNTQIVLRVSQGPEPVTVPDLEGQTAEAAAEALAALELVGDAHEEYSYEVERGLVISQDPASGTTAYVGGTVSYQVSKGPEFVEVPNVYGMGLDDAIATLEGAGFTVEVHRVANFFNSVGAQQPSGGDMVSPGSVVSITVV